MSVFISRDSSGSMGNKSKTSVVAGYFSSDLTATVSDDGRGVDTVGRLSGFQRAGTAIAGRSPASSEEKKTYLRSGLFVSSPSPIDFLNLQ